MKSWTIADKRLFQKNDKIVKDNEYMWTQTWQYHNHTCEPGQLDLLRCV